MLRSIRVNEFHFDITGPADPLYLGLVQQKVLTEKEKHPKGKYPIGEVVFLLHALDIPFFMSFLPMESLTEEQNEKLRREEYAPYFDLLVKAGILQPDGSSVPKQTPPAGRPSI
jgi:hypothetical protein